MKIGVVANTEKNGAPEFLRELSTLIRSHDGVEAFWEEQTARLIGQTGVPWETILTSIDLLLVAGGDGSLLDFARRLHPAQIPILGINLGRLGFLTAMRREELQQSLDDLLSRKLILSRRMALECTLISGSHRTHCPIALNDIVIGRGNTPRLIRLQVRQGSQVINEYVSDGVIIATPTGSTAYSLSAGGPLVAPEVEVLLLTPICPHTLSARSLVLPPHPAIQVEISEQTADIAVQFDGQRSVEVKPRDVLEIKCSSTPILLAYLQGYDFFSILREKLKWSGASV